MESVFVFLEGFIDALKEARERSFEYALFLKSFVGGTTNFFVTVAKLSATLSVTEGAIIGTILALFYTVLFVRYCKLFSDEQEIFEGIHQLQSPFQVRGHREIPMSQQVDVTEKVPIVRISWQMERILMNNPHVFVLFYLPICNFCNELLPTYERVADILGQEGGPQLLIAANCYDGSIGTDFGVNAFPTLKYYRNGVFILPFTDYDRTESALLQFMRNVISNEGDSQ